MMAGRLGIFHPEDTMSSPSMAIFSAKFKLETEESFGENDENHKTIKDGGKEGNALSMQKRSLKNQSNRPASFQGSRPLASVYARPFHSSPETTGYRGCLALAEWLA